MPNVLEIELQMLNSQEQSLRARAQWLDSEQERLRVERQRLSYHAHGLRDAVATRRLDEINNRLTELAGEEEEIRFALAELADRRQKAEARRPAVEYLIATHQATEAQRLVAAREVEAAVELLRERLEQYLALNTEARALAVRLERPDAERYSHTLTRFGRFLYWFMWPHFRYVMERPGGPRFDGSWAELEGSHDITLTKPELLGPPISDDDAESK